MRADLFLRSALYGAINCLLTYSLTYFIVASPSAEAKMYQNAILGTSGRRSSTPVVPVDSRVILPISVL